MLNVAILGFGKVGQSLVRAFEVVPSYKKRFNVSGLWNRSPEVFNNCKLPPNSKVYPDLDDLVSELSAIDLVIECSHPSIVQQYAGKILGKSDFFVSSPTAFADNDFLTEIQGQLAGSKTNCYLGLGASLGVWDIIRLDRNQQVKSLEIEMKKHPDSFKLPGQEEQDKQQLSRERDGDILLAAGNVGEINVLAPQNTNTMSIFALAASELGFAECQARITANRNMDSHIVWCTVGTQSGLKIEMLRDNPAGHGQVTGSATFTSFLESVAMYDSGIRHNGFVFC